MDAFIALWVPVASKKSNLLYFLYVRVFFSFLRLQLIESWALWYTNIRVKLHAGKRPFVTAKVHNAPRGRGNTIYLAAVPECLKSLTIPCLMDDVLHHSSHAMALSMYNILPYLQLTYNLFYCHGKSNIVVTQFQRKGEILSSLSMIIISASTVYRGNANSVCDHFCLCIGLPCGYERGFSLCINAHVHTEYSAILWMICSRTHKYTQLCMHFIR